MNLPSAIIFINPDINMSIQEKLTIQLSISEVITGDEFDTRVINDPNYPVLVHLNNLRILVIRNDLYDQSRHELADLVLFIKNGLATVLKNNYGPPTVSMQYERLNLFNLLANIKNTKYCCQVCKCGCRCNCFKHLPAPLQHMLLNYFDISGVHNANCDNEYNNIEFINRS